MIKFFRKIRYDLLEKNKTGKYLKYAIGEIVLVVVGILIALSMNNWNQYRLERVGEDNYLYRITADLKQDTTYLNYKIKEAKRAEDSLRLFFKLIHEKQNSHLEFIRLLNLGNWNPRNVILQDNTYLEITNSGKFDLIEGVELKENILDYYKFRDFTHEHIAETTNNGFELIIKLLPSLSRYYNYEDLTGYDVFGEDDWGWINSPTDLKFKELEASISQFRYKANISEGYYKQLYMKAEKILLLITDDVEK